VKFRRNQRDQPDAVADLEAGEHGAPDPGGGRPDGPWDSTEVNLEDGDTTRIDLGALIVTGKPGLELRLQVDERTQQVAAVLLLGPEGGVELRPFAAPRIADIWDDTRKQIAAETARRGGTATVVDGAFGKELQVAMSVTTPDGKSASQPSRVLGIRGPRWLLRVTFLGRPALEPDPTGDIETAMREVIVVRGNDPMPPGDPLPLVMPANAQPRQPPQA
jgi:hypothetical protein